MEVTQVLLARVIQIIKPIGAARYLPEIARKLKAKYEFVIAPKDEELVSPDPTQGAEFKHGKLVIDGRAVVVQQLAIFNDGVVVDTTTSTDDSDLFLTDLIQWAEDELPETKPAGPRLYLSNLEVHTTFPPENYVPTFGPVGHKIRGLLNEYGIEVPRYEFSGITLFFDQIGRWGPQPGAFNLERRANVPYDKNIWFAQAPLKTADHVKLLSDLEKQL